MERKSAQIRKFAKLRVKLILKFLNYLQSAGTGRVREDANDEHAEDEDKGEKNLRESP